MGLIVNETDALEIPGGAEARLFPADRPLTRAPGGGAQTAPIDDLGNFVFDELAPGRYRLELHLTDQIDVEDVLIGG